MNAKQVNKISIIKYLESKGVMPQKSYSSYVMYLSPFRKEIYPSLKVSIRDNLWVDYGANNIGGTLIDLILLLNPSFDVSEAIKSVSENRSLSFSFQQQKPKNSKLKSAIEILSVHPLTYNLNLCNYVKSRGIDFNLANQFVKAIKYRINPWTFWAVGNRNEKGWSLRNEKYKGCTDQDISFYTNNSRKICVFEGVFDFLSYITINKDYIQSSDYLILNSTSNLEKSKVVLEKFDLIELYLDRDYTGFNSSKFLKNIFGQKIIDKSSGYDGYKDLNLFLIASTIEKPVFRQGFRNL